MLNCPEPGEKKSDASALRRDELKVAIGQVASRKSYKCELTD